MRAWPAVFLPLLPTALFIVTGASVAKCYSIQDQLAQYCKANDPSKTKVLSPQDLPHPVYDEHHPLLDPISVGTTAREIITDTSKLEIACKGRSLKLPVLSKDGTMISALDESSGVTKVFEIRKDHTGCREIASLPFATAPADFSYDGNLLTYHKSLNLNENGSGDSNWNYFVQQPAAEWHQNIYVYNLKSGETQQLTHNTLGNSSYPAFLKDGTIIYTESMPAASGHVVSRYIIADPSKPQALETSNNTWCTSLKNADLMAAKLTTLSADPFTCRKIVSEKWVDYRQTVATTDFVTNLKFVSKARLDKISIKELTAACPSINGVKGPDATVKAHAHALSSHEVFAKKCAICHSTGEYVLDFKNLDRLFTQPSVTNPSVTKGDEFIIRLAKNATPHIRMPAGGQLEDPETDVSLSALAAAKARVQARKLRH